MKLSVVDNRTRLAELALDPAIAELRKEMAEQSVASVGQTIRRQVAAMNDAISRAIGRASELETMVHSEVAALERSYGENELRVRNLISELATERDRLAGLDAEAGNAVAQPGGVDRARGVADGGLQLLEAAAQGFDVQALDLNAPPLNLRFEIADPVETYGGLRFQAGKVFLVSGMGSFELLL